MEGPFRSPAFIAACLALLALVSSPAAQPWEAGATLEISTAVGIDANPSGNTATSLGDIDACVSVTAGQTFEVDIFVADVADLAGWQAKFSYDPSVVSLTSANMDLFLAADAESMVLNLSSPVSGEDGAYAFAAVDVARIAGESGTGVLARANLQAVAPGGSPLALDEVILGNSVALPIGDVDGDRRFDGTVSNAQVWVNEPCPSPLPTLTPPATATVGPTVTPAATPATPVAPSPTPPTVEPPSPAPTVPPDQLTADALPTEVEDEGGFPWTVVVGASAAGVVAAVASGLVFRQLLRRGR